jgi:hypothetical protein
MKKTSILKALSLVAMVSASTISCLPKDGEITRTITYQEHQYNTGKDESPVTKVVDEETISDPRVMAMMMMSGKIVYEMHIENSFGYSWTDNENYRQNAVCCARNLDDCKALEAISKNDPDRRIRDRATNTITRINYDNGIGPEPQWPLIMNR